jgi:hypothetical protein
MLVRYVVAFSLAALAFAPAPGSPSPWTGNDIPVAASPDLEFSPLIVPDGAGGAVVAWVRFNPDSGGVYALGLDSDGSVRPGWLPGGRFVLGGTDPSMVPDGSGGAYIASRAIVAQHFGPSGAVGAAGRAPNTGDPSSVPHGLEAAGPLSVQHNGLVLPVVVADGQGGLFVSFTDDQRFYDDAYVRHFGADGSYIQTQLRGWPTCGRACYGDHTPTICSDGAGGVFAAWSLACGVSVLRLGASLEPAPGWPDSGVAVVGCTVWNPYAGICPDASGGAYVVWQGYPSGPSDLHIQHVTASGSLASGWSLDGLVLSPYPTLPGFSRPYFGNFCAVVPDGQGGALVSWTDKRADDGDVYVTRVTPEGTIADGWPRYGVGAGIADGTQQWPLVVADGSGGALVAWQDERNDPDFAIYMNHVGSPGGLAAPATAAGVLVSAGPGLRLIPRLASDGAGGAFIAWVDYRAGNPDIYAAHVQGDGGGATVIELLSAEPDTDGVHLEWKVSAGAPDSVRLERRSDESEFALMTSLAPSSLGQITYHDRRVEPGLRYGYRLGFTDVYGSRVTDVAWVTMASAPPSPPPRLALQAIHPNPAADHFAVTFELPERTDAWIEIVDPGGRVWARREVGALGPGLHVVTMEPEHRLPAGIYMISLRSAGELRAKRVCVIR